MRKINRVNTICHPTSPGDERDLLSGHGLELRVPVAERRGRRMGKTLNVLLIEDSEDDAMLIVHELEHGGYEVDFERCDSAAAIKDALARRKWDVILSDHAMPRICAPEALHIVRESTVETPFIVVPGWMRDLLSPSRGRARAISSQRTNLSDSCLPSSGS